VVARTESPHRPNTQQDIDLPNIPVISIVDDDQAVLEATNGLIRSLGYDAATFASAEAFLESERVCDTSCLITDLHMPGLNGLDLQARLIADGHRMPVIFITAFPDDSVRARAMNAGAICFMSKPFTDDHLIRCLNKALNSSAAN
jgi:FixJ family two-component response regulator